MLPICSVLKDVGYRILIPVLAVQFIFADYIDTLQFSFSILLNFSHTFEGHDKTSNAYSRKNYAFRFNATHLT